MLVYPNYKKSVVNVIASIKKFYRLPVQVPTIPSLDAQLNRMYKNVVLIVLGGVGENMLKGLLRPSDILLRLSDDYLTAVCPCCPASADVSCLTGLTPAEHGRLGQNMFFKEFCRTVDLSSNIDPYSGQTVSVTNAADFILPYDNILGDIADSILGNVQPFSIAARGVKIAENKSYHKIADSPRRMFELIRKIAETDQNTFTLVMWNTVRDTAASCGCYSEEAGLILRDISDTLNGLSESLTDTLFIVTSSHGMTDISAEINLNLKYDLCDCLIMPPSFGTRAVNFFVKHDRRGDFERAFEKEFSGEFILFNRSDILRKELFGLKPVNKVYDFLGDYCAFAIGNTTMRFRALNEKHKAPEKAACGGFTSDEMSLPFVIIPTPQTDGWRRPLVENISPQ